MKEDKKDEKKKNEENKEKEEKINNTQTGLNESQNKESILKINQDNQNNLKNLNLRKENKPNIVTPHKEEVFHTKESNWKMNLKKKFRRFYNSKAGEFLRKHFFNKTDLIIFAINIISIIFYKISLMPCDKDPSECTIKRGLKFYFMVGTFTAISAGLYAGFIT